MSDIITGLAKKFKLSPEAEIALQALSELTDAEIQMVLKAVNSTLSEPK